MRGLASQLLAASSPNLAQVLLALKFWLESQVRKIVDQESIGTNQEIEGEECDVLEAPYIARFL